MSFAIHDALERFPQPLEPEPERKQYENCELL